MAFEKQQRRSTDFRNCSLSSSLKLYMVYVLLNDVMSQSIPTGYIPPGISSKRLPGGSGFDFWKLPGGREFDKGGDFVEIESETFCPSIGFISDK